MSVYAIPYTNTWTFFHLLHSRLTSMNRGSDNQRNGRNAREGAEDGRKVEVRGAERNKERKKE